MERKNKIPKLGSLFLLGLINGFGWGYTEHNLGLDKIQTLAGMAASGILIVAFWYKHLAWDNEA